MPFTTGDNNFGTAKWIVNATAGLGTHTTIASALTSASSGDTIFIMPGTYTEDLTLKAGVNLTANVCDGVNLVGASNVTIKGKATYTGSGTVSISGISFQTNSDYCIVVSGTNASVLLFTACIVYCQNHDGINYTNSNAASSVFFQYSQSEIVATFKLYVMTSTGSLSFYYCSLGSASTAASTNSAGTVTMEYANSNVPMTTSSSGVVAIVQSDFVTNTNVTVLTTAGTGSSFARNSSFAAGTASSISIGTGTTVTLELCNIISSNTDAVTGAGTLNYSGITFSGSSVLMNTTTQTGGIIQGGVNQAPSAGFVGEQIRATANGSITSTATSNLTSISLTAGIWDVTGIANYAFTTSATVTTTGLSTTSATFTGTQGDDYVNNINAFGLNSQVYSSIPARRITLTSTTTYYLVISATFVSTATCFGRISATRVG